MLEWHAAHGGHVSLTARHFGWSRPTVYRWLARHDGRAAASGPLQSSRTLPSAELDPRAAVRGPELRRRHPRWGKAKLAVLLRREGIELSVSMTGRILDRLRQRGELAEPHLRGMTIRSRRPPQPRAIHKPKGYAVDDPMTSSRSCRRGQRPRPQPAARAVHRPRRQPLGHAQLSHSATARHASAILDAMAQRMPFTLQAIQVDRGSEVMADFEARCAATHRALRPAPHSPKLNGHVERANGTHTAEFWEVTDAEPGTSRCARPCSPGRRATTRSGPTRPWAI